MSVRPTPLMRLPLLAGLFTLTYLTYSILSPFLVPLAWAAVLVFVTWPLYRHLLRLCGHRENVAAGLMTALLMLLMVGPLAWLLVMLQAEVRIIYAHLSEFLLRDTLDLPEMVTSDYPWLASLTALAVTLTLGGTATNDVDYTAITSPVTMPR